MTEDEKRSLIYGGTPSQKSIPVQGGAASRVQPYSELNDMLNSSPETQFLGTQPTPTPTPTPAPKGLNAAGRTNPYQFFNQNGNTPTPTPSASPIIPATGAGPYWYVDPRAGNYQGMPINHSDLEQGALNIANPNIYSPPHEDQASNHPMSPLEMADLQKKYGFNYG